VTTPSASQPNAPRPVSKRALVRTLLVGGVLLLLLVVALGAYVLRPCRIDGEKVLTVAAGQSLSRVAHQLEEQGLVAYSWSFRVLTRWRGQGRKIQAGTYRFVAGEYRPGQVLQILVDGRVELIQCTLPEGLTAMEVVQRCSAAGLGQLKRYQALLTDDDLLAQLNIATSLEGYLFPETYRFAPGVSEASVLKTMITQMRAHLDPALLAAARQNGLNERQLLTLASIVQKEAGNTEEMPLIAAVFHNRLKRGMRLQADPTVIYGLGSFDGNLTREHLRTPTPYNTYVHGGLPPGPIANPGLAALRAAAWPADEKYLYFVATGEGGHYFSRTLQEHNRAVQRYQLHR